MHACTFVVALHKENKQASFGLGVIKWSLQWSFEFFFSRWELSEEEESGGSDVETLVNQKQTAVSETLHKTPGCCNKCTQALYM